MSGPVILDMRPRRRRPRTMKNARRREILRLLIEAQGNLCAHCEQKLPTRWTQANGRAPTIEHVVPWSKGGSNAIANLLVKHKMCNEAGGCRPPSRRDRKWQMIVWAWFQRYREIKKNISRDGAPPQNQEAA